MEMVTRRRLTCKNCHVTFRLRPNAHISEVPIQIGGLEVNIDQRDKPQYGNNDDTVAQLTGVFHAETLAPTGHQFQTSLQERSFAIESG